MSTFIIECSDDHGDRLEAHCEQWEGDPPTRFTVDLVSAKGLRGHFVIDVPAGVSIKIALTERIHKEWIHAQN